MTRRVLTAPHAPPILRSDRAWCRRSRVAKRARTGRRGERDGDSHHRLDDGRVGSGSVRGLAVVKGPGRRGERTRGVTPWEEGSRRAVHRAGASRPAGSRLQRGGDRSPGPDRPAGAGPPADDGRPRGDGRGGHRRRHPAPPPLRQRGSQPALRPRRDLGRAAGGGADPQSPGPGGHRGDATAAQPRAVCGRALLPRP